MTQEPTHPLIDSLRLKGERVEYVRTDDLGSHWTMQVGPSEVKDQLELCFYIDDVRSKIVVEAVTK